MKVRVTLERQNNETLIQYSYRYVPNNDIRY